MKDMKFQIVESTRPFRGERWHFRIVAPNGEILASSEKYHNRQDVVDAITYIKTHSTYASVVDL